MSRSLARLATLRARLKKHAEAEHARHEAAHARTLGSLERLAPADGDQSPARILAARDQFRGSLWRQEAAQRAASADSRARLLHAVGEHKKVEKIVAARAEVALAQAARLEAQVQEAWLRHRLHKDRVGR